jgi:dCMP deaminase
MTDSRLTWDATWHAVAKTIGRRSQCSRAQVGAVIVTADNRVASTGYNGPARGQDAVGPCTNWCPRAQGKTDVSANYDACPAIHAEANALLRADWTQIQAGTIYVSHASCINCAKLVANSGLTRLVHFIDDKAEQRNPDEVEAYLRRAGMHVERTW